MPVKPCGAKARTKGGAPCSAWAMANGRCRMHGGKLGKHGNYTLRARTQRKKENAFLRDIKTMNNQIDLLFSDESVA